jgi:hypothetical protein
VLPVRRKLPRHFDSGKTDKPRISQWGRCRRYLARPPQNNSASPVNLFELIFQGIISSSVLPRDDNRHPTSRKTRGDGPEHMVLTRPHHASLRR